MNASSMSAEELFEACAGGSEPAWQEFRKRYHDAIRGVTYRIARRWECIHLHEDLVQDVYAKLCGNDYAPLKRYVHQFDNSDVAYIKVVAANAATERCKQVAARPDSSSEALPLGAPSSAQEPAAAGDDGIALRLTIRDAENILRTQLPDKTAARDLTVFRCYYVLGMTAAQIASLRSVGLSVAGVDSLLFRCRKILTESRTEKGMPAMSRYRKWDSGA